MSYHVSVDNRRTYLRFTVRGEQNFDSNQELVEAIVASCTQHGVGRVLVDIREYRGQPGTVWDYELAKLASQKTLGIVTRTAILASPETREFTSFFETAARNRGLSLQSFVSPEEAQRWIEAD